MLGSAGVLAGGVWQALGSEIRGMAYPKRVLRETHLAAGRRS